ncbi:MAG: uracil-DNA glycosylase family protein [Myxococcaceae bacterium]|nr:uracil-DNA glycosylase family protein [Myxococcaceae bacterium]
MKGHAVHGPAIASKVVLIGQAPGVHEESLGRPFAWTAGKTLFRWFHETLGVDEQSFRDAVYMTAVARCFPGKAKSGDRRPDADEIARCGTFLSREVTLLRPELILPVGTLAIEQVLGEKRLLTEVVGTVHRVRFHGVECDAVPLPHPSGASTWHRVEPGVTLLREALGRIAKHPAVRETFGRG